MNTELRGRVAMYLAVLPALLAVTAIRLRTPMFVGDDAYITFRVSQNLLNGNGLVYNAGEYFSVTTTPLWASLIAALSALFRSEPAEVFRPVEYLLNLLNCILVFAVASSAGRYVLRGSLSALLFALSWNMNFSSMIGMEPPLFVSLLLLSVLLQQYERWRPMSAVAAALAFLTRPEGMFLLPILGLYRIWKDKKIPWPELLVGSAIVVSYLLWVFWYFGTIVPHAGMAKSLAYYRDPWQALSGLRDHLLIFTITPLFDIYGWLSFLLPAVLWVLWGVGVFVGAKQSAAHGLLGAFTLSVLLLYAAMNPMLFEWYVVPLEVSYSVSLVWGAAWVLGRLSKLLWRDAYPQLAGFVAAILLLVAVLRYQSFALALRDGPGGYRHWPSIVGTERLAHPFLLPALSPQFREKLYIELASRLEPEVTAASVVMGPEFGAFGYHSSSKILSSIGHTNGEIIQYLPVPREQVGMHINNGISQQMIDVFQPDYVLALEAFIRHGVLRSKKFHDEYELLAKMDSAVFGSKGLYLFKRRSPAAESGSNESPRNR